MHRSVRVAGEIKRILSVALHSEIKDPRLPVMATVTEVEVSRDLSWATIYVSTLGDDKEKEEMMECLADAKGFLRSYVARLINLRVAPDLRFRLDESSELGSKMDQLIDSVIAKDEEMAQRLQEDPPVVIEKE